MDKKGSTLVMVCVQLGVTVACLVGFLASGNHMWAAATGASLVTIILGAVACAMYNG
jgi:hypothetical protein